MSLLKLFAWTLLGVAVLVVLWNLFLRKLVDDLTTGSTPTNTTTPPVQGPLGGAVPKGATDLQKDLTPGTGVVVAGTPPVPVPKVSYITITKDNTVRYTGDHPSFQIGEIKVWSYTKQLAIGDFSDMSYNYNMGYAAGYPVRNAFDGDAGSFLHTDGPANTKHIVTLTLASPAVVTKVEVLNRQDTCCNGRLEGVVVAMWDANKTLLNSFVLTSSMAWQVWNVPK